MRIQNSFAAAVAAAVSAVVFSAAFQPAEAAFVFYAEQSGTNVVINGTGSINTTGLGAFNFPFGSGFGASIQQNSLGIGTSVPPTAYFNAVTSGPANVAPLLSGSNISPSLTSGGYFQIGSLNSPTLYLPTAYVSNTPFSNSATWYGQTMSDWGWPTNATWASPVTVGTWTTNNGETFSVVAVPEPTQMVSVAAVGAMYGAWRLRKLRRSRITSGDVTAG
jgi:hypothetical protein